MFQACLCLDLRVLAFLARAMSLIKYVLQVIRAGSDMDSVCDAMPGLRNILPTELGGLGGSTETIIGEIFASMFNVYGHL